MLFRCETSTSRINNTFLQASYTCASDFFYLISRYELKPRKNCMFFFVMHYRWYYKILKLKGFFFDVWEAKKTLETSSIWKIILKYRSGQEDENYSADFKTG